MALYACMYFAALRPAEAVALRQQDCYLPAGGRGRLTLEKSRPEVNRRWSDTGSRGTRGLDCYQRRVGRSPDPCPDARPGRLTACRTARPYNLRHAAVSLWLNAGVPATQVAERAGHSVEVLLRVYAKRIDAALRDF